MGDISEFEVGQTVELHDGRIATVRFVGGTSFAPGDWVGVELEDKSGKNDGAVQGQRYFNCPAGQGMFLRPAAASIIEHPTPKAIKKPTSFANGAVAKPRMEGGPTASRRQSVLDGAAKRSTINAASPTPSVGSMSASRTLTVCSQTMIYLTNLSFQIVCFQISDKAAIFKALSGATASRNPAPLSARSTTTASKSRTSIVGRPSLGVTAPSTNQSSRLSILGNLNGPSRPGLSGPIRKQNNRLSLLQQNKRSGSMSGSSQASAQNGNASPAESIDADIRSASISDQDVQLDEVLSPSSSQASAMNQASLSPPTSDLQTRPSAVLPQRSHPSNLALNREVEDLKTKLRLMEKKRMEDRDKMKTFEKIQGERDKFESIITKLQAKYQPQQQELADLRKRIKEAESKAEASESQQFDVDTAVEMATLDREMAEEASEAYKIELEALRQKNEELELEIEVLREENSELGKEMSPEERTSQGWLQLERNNERLREALIRLRDMSQEHETELKAQIQELEKDAQAAGGLQERYDGTKEKLDQSESVVEDLRQQLDTALGAEEMIEELTERNMTLTQNTDELKLVIEDLESLKELNDELEINHVETEKQLQDEIDYREATHLEQLRKAAAQEETIQDLEYTVTRFRELVTNLQSDLEDMRASQQISETQANELNNRSRAMMDLNLRLQVSASKSQVKAIDLELRKLEAQESTDHLAIVQEFLPESYAADRGSVDALLRLKRVGFKANLLHEFVRERANGVAVPGHEDDMFICCEVLDQLTWVHAMCSRFVKFVESCSIEAFKRLDSALYDLEPVERALNGWIDGLKKDSFKEKQCAGELHRYVILTIQSGGVY